MNSLEINKKNFVKLNPYILPSFVYNTEGSLVMMPDGDKVIKKFYITKGPSFGNKLRTINSLIDLGPLINMEELVLPERIVTVDTLVIGYIMRYVDSWNLKEVLISKELPPSEKIYLLKEIGYILRKMKKVRESTHIKDFYLNDMHESNFIVDKKTHKLLVVDADSMKIDNNQPFVSKYLSPLSPLSNYPLKYREPLEPCPGSFIPDENTDLYCYIIMILNTVFGKSINRLTEHEYFNHLEYLSKLGLSKELIDIFSRVYSNLENQNPAPFLDELEPYIEMHRI